MRGLTTIAMTAGDTGTPKKHTVRNLLIVVTTCSTIGLVSGAAFGEVTRPLQGKHSMTEIANACSKAGGAVWGMSDGSYGCLKGNCDGKGGDCSVTCKENGKCTGTTPQIVHGRIFKNLNQVFTVVTSPPGGRPARRPSGGLLEPNTGFSPQGPAATGTPLAPPPTGGPVLR
jgi:hypothetical protein